MQQNDLQIVTQAPDISEAFRFLEMLDKDNEKFNFETIEEPKPKQGTASVRRLYGTFSEHKEALQMANLNGNGIFVAVNATDGKGRKEENIERVRAVFVDLDGSSLEPVLEGPLKPHIVAESSPGRYHAYWIVEGCPLDQFKGIQQFLAGHFSGDPAVCDLPRLMRIPGFQHRKNEPFKSHIIETSDTKPYTFEVFREAFGLNSKANTESASLGRKEKESATLCKLRERGLVKCLENEDEGRWSICCPWAREHTGGGDDAHYFSKASKDYPGEGFKCFHSHCKDRNIQSLRFFLGLAPFEGVDPLPLFREVPPASLFPVEALGPILGAAAKEMQGTIKAPLAVIAQSLLGAASLVTQAHANIGIDGRITALSLFLITVAESGERKSAVDDVALADVFTWQKHLCVVHREEFRAYQVALEAWKKKQKTSSDWNNNQHGQTEPEPPIQPIILIEEPTYEGLVKYLEGGQPSVGLFSDEGGRFLGGSAMSRDNVLKTLAGFSSFWDAKPDKPITRIRSGDKTLALYGRRVALHLMIQESVYSQLNQQSMCESQGFLPRCLIAFPESMAGQRTYVKVDPKKGRAVCLFRERCNSLLDRKYPTEPPPEPQNQLTPPTIELTGAAKDLWVHFHDRLEAQLGSGQRYHSIRRFGSKAPEHLLRIAGVLALFENPEVRGVDVQYIERAAVIMDYYLAERLRLESYCCIDPNLLAAQKVLDWASAKGKLGVSLRELYQLGPADVRSKDKALTILRVLESHGRAFPIPAHELSPGSKGKAWRFIWPDNS